METEPWDLIKKHKYLLTIICLGLISFFNMLFNGFVWDDKGYILLNPEVHSLNLLVLFGKNMFNGFGYFRPFPATYFAILYSFFQQQAFPYHFFQLVIHIINTLLLWKLFSMFFNKKLAWCLSLIFLVHPIAVESVSYIASADNPLFFLFGISALLVLIYKDLTLRVSVSLGLLFFFTLLTKESGIMFMLFGIWYALLFERKKLKKMLLITVITLILYFLMRFLFVGIKFSPINTIPIASLPLIERFYSIPLIFFSYIKTYIFPTSLAIDQQWTVRSLTYSAFYLPLLADLLMLGLLLLEYFLIKKNKTNEKTYLFFSFWLLIGIGLYLQIFPLDMTVADRWFYAPAVGLLGILGSTYVLFEKYFFQKRKKIIIGFFVIVICLLSIRSIVRNTNWVDEETLYAHDIKITDSFDLEGNYATILDGEGRYHDAILHAKKSIQLNAYEVNVGNLALIYQHIGNFPLAKKYYVNSLFYPANTLLGKKHYLSTYTSMGIFLAERDDPHEAITFINNGLSEYPQSPDLWFYLAVAEYRLKNYVQADNAVSKAFIFNPNTNYELAKYEIENHLPLRLVNEYGNHTPIVINESNSSLLTK